MKSIYNKLLSNIA